MKSFMISLFSSIVSIGATICATALYLQAHASDVAVGAVSSGFMNFLNGIFN